MTQVFEFALLGLGAGALYVLGAIGVVLIHKGSGVVNFAQGAMAMVGTFVYWELRDVHHFPAAFAFVVGVAASGLLGFLTHAVVIRHLSDASMLTKIIATLGIMSTLQAGAAILYPAQSNIVASILPTNTVTIAGARVGEDGLIIFGIVLLLTAGLWAVYRFTPFGIMTTAVAENKEGAEGLGASPNFISAFNWSIGAALGGVAGILLAPLVGLQVEGYTLLIVPILAAAVVGNMSSFPLTLVGGLVIGIAQSEVTRFSTTIGLSTAIPFILIAILLISRGRSIIQRGEIQAQLPSLGTGRISLRWVGGAVAVGLLLLWTVPDNWVDAFTTQIVIAIVLLSVVVIVGYAGQLSLAQFTFAGLGALIAGQLITHGWPFELGLLVAIVVLLPIGAIIGLAGLRTRGLNLAIVTLGFAVTIDAMVFSYDKYTGGLLGIQLPTHLKFFGIDVDAVLYPARYGTLALVLFALAAIVLANIRRGRVGRRLIAVRSNERAASSLGISVMQAKLYAFMIGSSIAGLGGILLAFRLPQLSFGNEAYGPLQSVQILQQSVIGGVGWIGGTVVGGTLQPGSISTLLLNFLGSSVGNYIFLIGGVLLVLTVLHSPDGVAGRMKRIFFRRPRKLSDSALDALLLDDDASLVRVAPKTLEVSDLTVRYGGVVAVDGLSLLVQPGQVTSLIGPNGAGKTTVLDAITGFAKPYGGELEIDGKSIKGLQARQRVSAGLGRSFQSLELFLEMTVYENLLVACEPRDKLSYARDLVHPGKGVLSAAGLAAIRAFNLTDCLTLRPSELPHGKQRLLAIARALAAEPSVLLLDEPASGLTEAESRQLGRFIRRLADEWGMAVLLIEHNVSLVLDISDRIHVLDFGVPIAAGTPKEIRADRRVIEAYIGEEVDTEAQPLETGTEVAV